MCDKVAELKADVAELKKLLEEATRSRVKDALTIELRRVETLLLSATADGTDGQASLSAQKPKPATPTVCSVRLKDYAWDQSDKFVKFYYTIKGVQDIPDKQIALQCEPNRFEVTVSDVDGKNYVMGIDNLLEEVDPDRSSVKQKTDMVLVMLKKKTESGSKWQCVTKNEKQLKAMRAKQEKLATSKPEPEDTSDPTAGLMGLMKKMYQDGDENMKREIAKAWTQANDKKSMGLGDDFNMN